ncbi:MAG: hypothetical protein E4H20_12305, partial [Spirochaetales bacterium]
MTRVKTLPLAGIVIGVIIAGIGISMATDNWETTSTKEPVKFSQGEFAGQANPADIRGSYTWQDIETSFSVPAAVGAKAFSTPERAMATDERINVLEQLYAGTLPEGSEIGTDSVRVFVALYAGLPYKAEEGTVLPDPAIAILRDRPGVNEKDLSRFTLAAIDTDTVRTAAEVPGSVEPAAPQPASTAGGEVKTSDTTTTEEHTTPAYTVTGKTTFGELYGWGLTEAQVETAI